MNRKIFAGKVILWIAAIALSVIVIMNNRTPVLVQESLTAWGYSLSDPLYPGDVIEETFTPSAGWVESVELALTYDETVPDEDTLVLVEVLQGDEVLMQQELAVWVYGNCSFLELQVGKEVRTDSELTIRVTNASTAGEQCAFSMMTVDYQDNYLDNVSDYVQDGQTVAARLYSRYNYRTGYDYYKALTYAFWILAAALLITAALSGGWRRKAEPLGKRVRLAALAVILGAAFLSRFVLLGAVPAGTNQDEAMAAYNAYGLITHGIDARGYRFPVYFLAWGSGMNAGYSYLSIPFLKLFGYNMFAYRLPQAIVSFGSVVAVYVMCRRLFTERAALLAAFLLAINPWSIIAARYALESNLVPGMFVIGLCFFVLSFDKPRHILGAALFWGLTLYAYAQSWLMLPIFLTLAVICYFRELRRNRYALAAAGLLFVMAFPLLLFVAINLGWMPEIRTDWISIPKLDVFRSGELASGTWQQSLKTLIEFLLKQNLGDVRDVDETLGAYYYVTIPFYLFGIGYHAAAFVRSLRRKTAGERRDFLLLFWFVAAFIVAAMNQTVEIVHINLLHICVILYSAYGIWKLGEQLYSRAWLPVWCVFLAGSFGLLEKDVFSTVTNSYYVGPSAYEVIDAAKELADDGETIYIYHSTALFYSSLLWYEKPDVLDYAQNATYQGLEGWLQLKHYGRYEYIDDDALLDQAEVLIIQKNYEQMFRQMGYQILQVNEEYGIAYQ